jgi:type I restriction enzyme S subunit
MSRDMPVGWQEIALKDHIELVPGFAFSSDDFSSDPVDQVPLIRIRDLIAQEPNVYVPRGFEARYLIKTGDFLVGMDGEFQAVRWGAGEAALNQRVLRFASSSAKLDSEFLFYRLQPELKRLENVISATTVKHLSTKHLNALKIPLPPIAEQRRIAEILSSIDEAIQGTQTVVEQARNVKQGLLEHLLAKGIGHTRFLPTEIGEIPKGWQVARLGQVGAWSSGGTPSKSNPDYWGGDIPWISPKDMKRLYLDDAEDHVTGLGAVNGTRLMPAGTLLIVVRGMILARYVPVAITLRASTFNQDIKALKCNDDYSPHFVRMWLELQNEKLMKLIDSATHGTKRLPQEALLNFAIPSAPRAEQDDIVIRVRAIEDQIETNLRLLDRYHTTKSALMVDLLSGRKRVSDDLPMAAE